MQRAGSAPLLHQALAGPASGAASNDSATAATVIPQDTGEPVREVLVSSSPAGAPGALFELLRVTVPAGAVLAAHSHPGDEMAIVLTGALTYHVVANGSLTINRADGRKETAGPGEMVILEAGDSLLEPEGMVHRAENTTDHPVVFLASTLFEAGAPTAIAWEATPVATPAT
jgi:quercetin dioxygenase-like cupin family protein